MVTYSSKSVFIYSPLFVILYNLAGNLSNDIYLPVLPILTGDLNTSNFLVQFSITVWFLGVAIPQIYFGLMAHRYGSRPLMLWGGVVFLLGTFSCFIATHIYILLLGRFLQGIGVSSLNIATFTTVRSRFYDEKGSIKFISWVNMMGSVAPLAGPIVGSYLGYFFGWRSTFLFILLLATCILIGLYYFLFEENEQPQKVPFSFSSVWMYYGPLFKNKYLWHLLLSYTSLLGAVIAYLTTAPFIFTKQFGVPLKHFGLTQIPPSLACLLGAFSVIKLVNKYHPLKAIYLGFGVLFFSALCLITLGMFSQFITLYYYLISVSLFMYGFAVVSSPLMRMILTVGAGQKGGVSALLGLTMATMAGLASFFTALFFHEKTTYAIGIILAFMLTGVTFFLTRKDLYDR